MTPPKIPFNGQHDDSADRARVGAGDRDAPLQLESDESESENQSVALPSDGGMNSMSQALRWALDSMHHPALAAADWLARDIDPSQQNATALLTNPNITIAQVRQAKSVFKTMRIVGEKSADRRIGARMYAAAIAVGLVRFNKKISTQSDEALDRGFQGLLDDRRMPAPLRDMAGKALCILHEMKNNQNHTPDHVVPRSKSA